MSQKEKEIKLIQKELRKKILNISYEKNSGHIGCSLSCIDILIATLILNNKKEELILSKGHAALALYVTLNYLKEISDKEIETFYLNGTKLAAHPSPNFKKSIPFATGSLGHGLPIATGMALANKFSKVNERTFVVVSDGETNEGTTWEASHFAVKHQLKNLVVIIDNNRIQGFDRTIDVLGNTSDINQFNEIGFEVFCCDGNNIPQILKILNLIENSKSNSPKLILADTIKGKGVKFMEDKIEWHYLPLDKKLLEIAISDIDSNY